MDECEFDCLSSPGRLTNGRGVIVVVLGVNAAYHEPAAALVVDGQLVAAVEEERFNRQKHGKRASVSNDELPWNAIQFCLKQAGISCRDVNHIGYSLNPWSRRSTSWADEYRVAPGGFGTPEGEELFFRAQILARSRLRERMPGARFHYFQHHACHAASAYFASPCTAAGILVADGIGESASAWAGRGSGNQLVRLHQIEYPHSLGFLWERVSEFLGFDRYEGPGKVMALGTIRGPVSWKSGVDYRDGFAQFVRATSGGQFEINPLILRYRAHDVEGLEQVFGPRERFLRSETERMALAAALQLTTEDVLLHAACDLWQRINGQGSERAEALCLAGGVALNCAANARIARESPWRKLWIQPAAHDAGTSLGAALLIWHQVLGHSQRVPFDNAYLGPGFTEAQCRSALEALSLPYCMPKDLPRQVARLVASGKAVGWFQGRMEFGPRALGNRSIVADPQRSSMPSFLNAKIKARETFRPYAPTVLADEGPAWFRARSADSGADGAPLEYMLLAVPAREKARQLLPAVVHRNEERGEATARVHWLVRGSNPPYEELVLACREQLGVPALLNTSLNVAEPIVCGPRQAAETFIRSGLDAIALGPFLVERRE